MVENLDLPGRPLRGFGSTPVTAKLCDEAQCPPLGTPHHSARTKLRADFIPTGFVPGVRLIVDQDLLQFVVFLLCFNQNWYVRVSIFPQREEVLVILASRGCIA